MTTLKEAALSYVKKDIFSLAKIPVDIEIKKAVFEKNGKPVEYQFIELDNWKYTLNSNTLSKIKQFLKQRPDAKFMKAEKTDEGEVYFIAAD